MTAAGGFTLPKNPGQPWLMPRTPAQSAIVRRAERLHHRLADYGYTVSTGPLVWNRHKASLRARPGNGRYPLIWAESVRSDGVFEFRAEKRNHKPYFQPKPKDYWVVTDFPCVLLQRTTAKEQRRRLIAAELPAAFISVHGAVVVENHLNMIKPLNGTPKVLPAVLAALLNSDLVDQVFRCINGSVAVSAYELEALPLPSPEELQELERLVSRARAPSASNTPSTAIWQRGPLMPSPLLPLTDIHERLREIFPEGTANRNYVIREIAAKTVFVMLYIGAVEGAECWLRPDQVTRMTDAQAVLHGHGDREAWQRESMRPAAGNIEGRWYAANTREPIRDETLREGLVRLGAVIEREGLPTTSPLPRYALAADFAALFHPDLLDEVLQGADRSVAGGESLARGARTDCDHPPRRGRARGTGAGDVPQRRNP